MCPEKRGTQDPNSVPIIFYLRTRHWRSSIEFQEQIYWEFSESLCTKQIENPQEWPILGTAKCILGTVRQFTKLGFRAGVTDRGSEGEMPTQCALIIPSPLVAAAKGYSQRI